MLSMQMLSHERQDLQDHDDLRPDTTTCGLATPTPAMPHSGVICRYADAQMCMLASDLEASVEHDVRRNEYVR